jgi:predicted dehydrogenase
MSRSLNRRKFLQATAASAGAAGFYLTGGVTESRAQNSANNRLNIAVVGCGGQGGGDLGNVIGPADNPRENLVAMCDVDDARASGHFNNFPNVPKFKDYRVMLDRVRNIDAVVVSTPDHMHAFASIAAMRMGKHVYTQKPLTHSVWEARQMKEVAAANRVATQMGNQGTAGAGLRRGVEAIRAGALGNVTEVHAWTNRPGTFWRQPGVRPKETQTPPATLDWDLWLGAAPRRPYHSSYCPFAWRGWWDFGTGALGDMGCHIMNLPFMALRLTAPTSVEASIDGTLNGECPPNGCTVTFDFPARGTQPACKFYWYEVRRPPERLRNMVGGQLSSGGSFIVGDRATMYSSDDYGANWRLLPQEAQAAFQAPEPSLPRANGHHAEWLAACKGGPPALSNFVDYASALTETVLLGNVAIRVQQKFTWDSANLRATDCPAAAQFIRRDYREGWSI